MPYPYSAKLQEFVEVLLARHGISLDEESMQLQLLGEEFLLVSQIPDRQQVRLKRFTSIYNRPPFKNLEIVFFIDEQGHWIPYQFYRPPTDDHSCGVIDVRGPKLVLDNTTYQRALASHCDLLAVRLHNHGWLERGMVFDPIGSEFEEFLWTDATVDEPGEEQLDVWIVDDVCEATDGCIVEPDGLCPHGHPSWLLRMGLI